MQALRQSAHARSGAQTYLTSPLRGARCGQNFASKFAMIVSYRRRNSISCIVTAWDPAWCEDFAADLLQKQQSGSARPIMTEE
jgi:hypothetical protein